ncbi:hypothetical protein E2C01_020395 [Portunus trituberculatus]|uniref:Uncharacterized protein n=1 Tax=Portunus trituberculatus TaxID=210409 RepID=A0A5B7E0D3_PORTR|nr:hypothetical protein [Portunus trituberculatus]
MEFMTITSTTLSVAIPRSRVMHSPPHPPPLSAQQQPLTCCTDAVLRRRRSLSRCTLRLSGSGKATARPNARLSNRGTKERTPKLLISTSPAARHPPAPPPGKDANTQQEIKRSDTGTTPSQKNPGVRRPHASLPPYLSCSPRHVTTNLSRRGSSPPMHK